MKVVCLTSSFSRRVLCAVAIAWIPFLSTSCATRDPAAAGSNLPRVQAITLAQQTARSMGGSVFTVAPTGSMKPTLDENSIVAVEAVPFTELRRGDIVVYRSAAGYPVVHRLFANTTRGWTVLGDNNAAVDSEPVTGANLLGRVCAIFYTGPGRAPASDTALAQPPTAH